MARQHFIQVCYTENLNVFWSLLGLPALRMGMTALTGLFEFFSRNTTLNKIEPM